MTLSIVTSSKSHFENNRVVLSKVAFTEALFSLGISLPPFQIRSSPFFPLMDFTDCSPRTNLNASATFDFPEPFGPTIAVTGVVNPIFVFLANDLKPIISSDFRYMALFYHPLASIAFSAALCSASCFEAPVPDAI